MRCAGLDVLESLLGRQSREGALHNAEASQGGKTNQGTCDIRLNSGSAVAYIRRGVDHDSEPQWPPDEGGEPLSQNNQLVGYWIATTSERQLMTNVDVVEGHDCRRKVQGHRSEVS